VICVVTRGEESYRARKFSTFIGAAVAVAAVTVPATAAYADKNSRNMPTPYGTLTSNAWHECCGGTPSGNTIQWDYQVSATIGGSQSVRFIKTEWTGGASLRNGANWSVSAGNSGISVGYGSTWQYVSQTKHWTNDNGTRSSSYRTNMVASPKRDYRENSVTLVNTASVQLKGDAKVYMITASI
jgi:hypothetical protein